MLKFKFGLLMVERCCCWLKRKLVVGISPEGFGTIAMIVNFVVAFTVKSFTPPPKMFKILWSTLGFLLVQEKQHIKSC
jgi:hypothetical protein